MFWSNSNEGHLPLHEGPFVPGCLDVMTGYGADSTFVRLFYPSSSDDIKKLKSEWPRWMYHENYLKGFAAVLRLYTFVLRLAQSFMSGDMRVPVVWGADPVDRSKKNKLPVIVLSHGLGACRFFYSSLCLQLASYGYVVAAVEHRDESSASTFFYQTEERFLSNKKTWLPFRTVSHEISQIVIRQRQLEVRTAECSKVLDLLDDLNEGRPLKNLVDPDQSFSLLELLKDRLELTTPTMMGHSFGGATALKMMEREKRFKQMVILDSWLYALKNEVELPKIGANLPKIFINTETFQMPNNLSVMRNFVHPSNPCFTIRATTHEHQCDSPLLMGLWLNMGMHKLDPTLASKINYHLVLRFLHQQLGDLSSWNDDQFLQKQNQHIFPAISINESKL